MFAYCVGACVYARAHTLTHECKRMCSTRAYVWGNCTYRKVYEDACVQMLFVHTCVYVTTTQPQRNTALDVAVLGDGLQSKNCK